MLFNSLYRKYNGRGIEDDFSYTSDEFMRFAQSFRRAVKKSCNFELVDFSTGHYDLSGFVKGNNGVLVYFSYSVLRGDRPLQMNARDPWNGILYRKAAHIKDYRGERNHFTNFKYFESDVVGLINRN